MTGFRNASGRAMRLPGRIALGALLLAAAAARAEEPKGCAGFKWPLDREAAALQAAGTPAPRTEAAKPDGTAYALALVPLAEARLPLPPERKSKVDPSTAGHLDFAAPPAAGAYQMAITVAAWIDVVQGGRIVHPTAFSGAAGCPGVRKSIRFALEAQPFAIQVSGTDAPSAALLVEPVAP